MGSYSRRCHNPDCGTSFPVDSLNSKQQYCSADCRIAALHDNNRREKRKA